MSSSTFRAAVVRTPGGPDSIEFIDVPVVEPGPGEVRVEIAAAPVNPVDLAVASGFFHTMGLINQPERTGLGWDFAGTVVAGHRARGGRPHLRRRREAHHPAGRRGRQ
jgi:NADPH:quinone reductase-like Zn-dependent oxidoreductase